MSRRIGWTWYGDDVPEWAVEAVERVGQALPMFRPYEVEWRSLAEAPQDEQSTTFGTCFSVAFCRKRVVVYGGGQDREAALATLSHELAHIFIGPHGYDHLVWTARLADFVFDRARPSPWRLWARWAADAGRRAWLAALRAARLAR